MLAPTFCPLPDFGFSSFKHLGGLSQAKVSPLAFLDYSTNSLATTVSIMASSNSAEAMRLEIERLTGAWSGYAKSKNLTSRAAKINSHKQAQHAQTHPAGGYQKPYYGRSNSYVNPNYRPTNKYIRPGYTATPVSGTSTSGSMTPPAASLASGVALASTNAISIEKKEVVLNGVAFESSGRSLVRKDRQCCGQ